MIVKALVSYDGFNYAGWQKQENALGIQQVIEEALYKITKENVDVVASGRTDAGVHAFGQVFHFETNKNIPAIQYERAINALLPMYSTLSGITKFTSLSHIHSEKA